MRLIDADALTLLAVNDDNGIAAVRLEDIARQPTIDPEELRPEGEWKVVDGFDWNEDVIYKCSVCKEEFVTIEGTPLDNLWNYCPNCGADMRGGK